MPHQHDQLRLSGLRTTPPSLIVRSVIVNATIVQVAATIIQKIQHPCDFRDAGCTTRCDIGLIAAHEERCGFRLVRCPHWACDEQVSLTGQ